MSLPRANRRVARETARPAWAARGAFTLVELLVVIAIVAILAALSCSGLARMRSISQSAYCANSLRQLGIATSLYLAEHRNVMYPYYQPLPGGRLWYFGFETSSSLAAPEGDRSVDVTQSPLYPYINQVGGIQVCPSFPYASALWKPKYAGASWGYGFNATAFPQLSSVNVTTLSHPSQILLFGDCAQVNNFQAPASPKNPLLEEFYEFDPTDKTTHFRHGGCANILFLDGHVEKFTMYPGTLDTRLPSVNVGRFTPVGSTQYLQ